MQRHPRHDAFESAFREMDKDGDGRLNAAELREALAGLGERLTQGEAEAHVARYDRDGSGAIEIGELVEALLSAE